MELFKKIFSAVKNFRYKLITLFVGTVLFGVLSNYLDGTISDVFTILSYIFSGGLGIYMCVLIFHAFRNTWNDGDKILAIIYGIMAIALIVFIICIAFFF